NAVLTRLSSVGVMSVCLGQVAGREVIAGAHTGTVSWWDAATGELLGERLLGDGFRAVAVAPSAGRVVVAAANWGTVELSEIDGPVLSDFPHGLGDLRAVTVADVAGRVFVTAGNPSAQLATWEWLGRGADTLGIADAGFPVRALAVAQVDGSLVVAVAEDGEAVGRVAIRYPSSSADDRVLSPPWLQRPLAVARLERGLVAVCDESPPVLRSVPSGDVVDGSPPAEDVATVLLGDSERGPDLVDGAGESAVLRSRPPSASPPRKAHQTTYRRRAPRTWPVTASTYALVGGRPVYVAGSYGGAVWIWDVKSGRVRGEPFGDPPETLPGHSVHAKPGVPAVSSVSVCTVGSRTYLASVCDGAVRLDDVDTRQPVTAPSAGPCRAVALGEHDGQLLMATGGDAGTVRLYDVDAGEQLTSLTLDRGIVDLWLVPGERTVAVLDTNFELLVLSW
ncbi:MAG TPA: hypothetical protein VJ653_07605, partial [Acidimicrobiales bacterium]|nr:hypothetical protein [Acidimicrobiales bacterium]